MGRVVMTAKTYDHKCYDLACHFLEDGEPVLDTVPYKVMLAKEIQQTIEDFIAGAMEDYEPRETGDAWSGGFADNH
jgi:hypothetical protein